MANYKDVLAEMLVPNDRLGSVIDTYLAIGAVLDARKKVFKGEYFSIKDIDDVILNCLFTLGFFPFFAAHGAAIRPLFLQAIQSEKESFIEDFFAEAIPCALTIAMPHRQKDYADIRKAVVEKFKRP